MNVIGVATSIPKIDLMKLGVSRAINDYTEIKSIDELNDLFSILI